LGFAGAGGLLYPPELVPGLEGAEGLLYPPDEGLLYKPDDEGREEGDEDLLEDDEDEEDPLAATFATETNANSETNTIVARTKYFFI